MHCFIVRSLLSSSALAGTVAAQRSMSTRRSPGVAHEERAKANRTKINLSIGPLSLAQRPYSGFVAWLWWRRGRGAPCLDAWWRVLSALAPTGLTTAALPQRLRGLLRPLSYTLAIDAVSSFYNAPPHPPTNGFKAPAVADLGGAVRCLSPYALR